MRGSVSKKIRKIILNDLAFRNRSYSRNKVSGQIVCDVTRRLYQRAKSDYIKLTSSERSVVTVLYKTKK